MGVNFQQTHISPEPGRPGGNETVIEFQLVPLCHIRGFLPFIHPSGRLARAIGRPESYLIY